MSMVKMLEKLAENGGVQIDYVKADECVSCEMWYQVTLPDGTTASQPELREAIESAYDFINSNVPTPA